jgi:8-oxo-dGTP pyrophosphatase MutT (NUDIX family)
MRFAMPVTPSPAATLVLLRDRDAVEVLLIQRHRGSRFAAGDFVFAGGKVEADDNPPDAIEWCRGLTMAEAARRLSLEDSQAALRYWIGAIREAFEEVGVLLAYGPDGRLVDAGAPRYGEYRRACQDDNRVFWAMIRSERLALATDRIVYFAHWITPEEAPLRFDTRFFAAEMPPAQEASADEKEIVAVRWLTPRGALEARAQGEISLRRPTMANLELLVGARASEVIARLGRRDVPTIRPRIVIENGVQRSLIPGDPGYF